MKKTKVKKKIQIKLSVTQMLM